MSVLSLSSTPLQPVRAFRDGSRAANAHEARSVPTSASSTLQAQFKELFAASEAIATTLENIVQAKALIFCALPYHRVAERSLTRSARTGRSSTISVTFTAVDPLQPLPYGADRALLGWLQTLGYQDPFITFQSLTQFFRAFGLSDSGRDYIRFRERLARLLGLAITVRLDSEEGESRIVMQPLKKAFTPKTRSEVRHAQEGEASPQLILVQNRYGFELDPDFWQYLRSNPVPLPLPLMRLFHSRPQGWDFAQFVLYRCFAARTPSVLPWSELIAQMGSTDRSPRRLKANLVQVLKEIRVVYSDFPAAFLPGCKGLQVEPWRPRIDRRLS